jgi:molecular chaperone GrpE
MDALMSGVEMTEKELHAILDRYGVKRIAAEGQGFDPHVHEALYEIPDASVPHGTILQVVQPGYTIHDRTLRPARVGIARGGPKPVTQPATEVEATGAAPEADDSVIEFPKRTAGDAYRKPDEDGGTAGTRVDETH